MNASISGGLAVVFSLVVLGTVLALRRLGRLPQKATFAPPPTDRAAKLAGYRLATFSRRALAWLFDFLLVAAVTVAFELGLALRSSHTGSVNIHFDPEHSLLDVVMIVAYFGLGTYWGRGQTLGKRLLRIRVVSLPHEQLSLWHCLERALGYAASTLEAGFGFWQYFTHPNCQTVHDRIAETIVVDSRVGSGTNAAETREGAPPYK